jgi:hypothetical protein
MAQQDARQRLVHWIETHAFNPVLRAKPEDYPAGKRDNLKDVQDRTRTEIERFQHYGSAEDVVTNFKRDLNSEPARRVHRQLDDLGLPTLNSVQDKFEKFARDLGVNA